MQHKSTEEEKAREFEDLFMSLDEDRQEKALHILRTFTANQADTVASDFKREKEKQMV